MASFTYNGVSLAFPFHTDFRQEAVYEDVGDTDRIYTRFDITVQALLNTNYIQSIDPTIPANSNPATMMKAIRTKLMTYQKQLQVTVGGIDLIPANQTGNAGTVDAKNGPKPQSCAINALTETTFLVSYRVIAHYWENNTAANPNTNSPGDDILFNRWTESVDIDELNYSTITRDGTYAIRSDNVNGRPADQYRESMAVLSIPAGCKRMSANYTITPDGLRLRYRVVDREVFREPPSPAFKARGTYSETTTRTEAKRYGRCEVELEGSKDSLQSELLQTACQIASAKLRLEARNTSAFVGIMASAEFSVDLYENKVRVSVKALLQPRTANANPRQQQDDVRDENAALVIMNRFTFRRAVSDPVGSATGTAPPPHASRGNPGGVAWLLQAAAYFDPSVQKHILNIDRQITPGDEPGTTR